MRKILLCVLVLSLIAGASVTSAADLTFDDFMPIVQAPSDKRDELRNVKDPDAVSVSSNSEIPTIKAKTIQDGFNAFTKRHEMGAVMIEASNGEIGFIATGSGTYDMEMSNITAVRISQRLAYLQGLMDAKVQLSKLVKSADIAGYDIYGHSSANENTDDTSSTAHTTAFDSMGSSHVANVLKGYVTYDVFDGFNGPKYESTVFITIAVTPKTMGMYSRPVNDTIMAQNLSDGMNAVLAEIQTGVVPPVGGRIVDVPTTGEIAFVGFGSCVVQDADKAAVRAINRRDAQKIATLRAESELCGILTGDNVDGQANYRESIRQAFGNFQAIEDKDPLKEFVSSEDIAQVEAIKEGFRQNQEFNEAISTARKGLLPPGVTRRTWLDDEGIFAYSVAVYVPSATNKAAAAGKAMDEANLIQKIEPNKATITPQTKTETPEPQKAPAQIKRGVTGTIQQNL